MNFKIKLLAIFVILIFCLSPLAAVDLDQVNNTKVDNQTVKVVNESVDVVNETVDAVNESVDAVNETVDVVKQETNVKKDTKSLKSDKLKPNLQAHIDDVNEDEDITITITADHNLTGTVYYYFDCDPNVYSVYLRNGKAKQTIDPNGKVPAGQHTVEFYYLESANFKPDYISVTFNVIATKIDPNLDISLVGEAHEGSDIIFDVTADKAFSEDLTLYVDPGMVEAPVKIKDGLGKVRISGLTAGTYTAQIFYYGNDTFKRSTKTIKFTVLDKIDPNLSLEVKSNPEGYPVYVKVLSDKRFDGTVTIKLNNSDKVYNLTMFGGDTTQVIRDLPAGEYTVTVSFPGDNKYQASETTTTFTVAEKI